MPFNVYLHPQIGKKPYSVESMDQLELYITCVTLKYSHGGRTIKTELCFHGETKVNETVIEYWESGLCGQFHNRQRHEAVCLLKWNLSVKEKSRTLKAEPRRRNSGCGLERTSGFHHTTFDGQEFFKKSERFHRAADTWHTEAPQNHSHCAPSRVIVRASSPSDIHPIK